MSEKHTWDKFDFSTRAIHAAQDPEKWDSRTVVTPIIMATTFKRESLLEHNGHEYGRISNPTRDTLEENLASLEKAKYAVTYASGLGAVSSTFFILKSGDHIVSINDCYSGTNVFFRNIAKNMGVEVTFVDAQNLKETEDAFRDNTAMIWLESPTNPLLKLIDIQAVSKIAKRKNPSIIVVVDNTFATSYLQSPLELGADISLHAITKYINGHTDVIMGVVLTNDDGLHKRLRFNQILIGAIPSPFDCFLVLRGIKTLALRMKEHSKNALAVARALEKNPRIEKVIYPGLESHPQHELAKKQMRDFGGMLSVYLKGGLEETKTFLNSIKIFALAESLGGYESIIKHPGFMPKLSIPKELKEELGITDNFLRVSIGIENADDLIEDLNQALIKAMPNIP